jgi:hypothetical protein
MCLELIDNIEDQEQKDVIKSRFIIDFTRNIAETLEIDPDFFVQTIGIKQQVDKAMRDLASLLR